MSTRSTEGIGFYMRTHVLDEYFHARGRLPLTALLKPYARAATAMLVLQAGVDGSEASGGQSSQGAWRVLPARGTTWTRPRLTSPNHARTPSFRFMLEFTVFSE